MKLRKDGVVSFLYSVFILFPELIYPEKSRCPPCNFMDFAMPPNRHTPGSYAQTCSLTDTQNWRSKMALKLALKVWLKTGAQTGTQNWPSKLVPNYWLTRSSTIGSQGAQLLAHKELNYWLIRSSSGSHGAQVERYRS